MTDKIADVAVVALERGFADDVVGFCSRCTRTVYYRPHTARLLLPVVCVECWLRTRGPDEQHVVTDETVREVLLYFAAKGRPQ